MVDLWDMTVRSPLGAFRVREWVRVPGEMSRRPAAERAECRLKNGCWALFLYWPGGWLL